MKTIRRSSAAVVAALSVVAALLVAAAPSPAATGDVLDEFDAYDPSVGVPDCVRTGIAFDGSDLILSCQSSNQLDLVNASTHAYTGTVTVTGLSGGIWAIAYDAARDRLWACTDFGQTVSLIDMNAGSLDPTFTPFTVDAATGCWDGLAYDAADDSLWMSHDVATDVYHYTTNGTLLGSFSVAGMLGDCGNSGIAVGGSTLYLANNGCSQIYGFDKMFTASTLIADVAGTGRRIEDMECDDVTFPGKTAIWSQDAFDGILTAWEIPDGTCAFGGGGEEPPVFRSRAEGYGLRARLPLSLDTGTVARSYAQNDGSDRNWVVDVRFPPQVAAQIEGTSADASARMINQEGFATGTGRAAVADLVLTPVPGLTITASAIVARATASAAAGGAPTTSSEGSGFANLRVNTQRFEDSIPNQTITIPGVGTLVLREEIPMSEAGFAAIRVNMIHFTSADGSTEIIVSSAFASAGVDAPGTTGVPQDPCPSISDTFRPVCELRLPI